MKEIKPVNAAKGHQGVTLVELLIVIVIILIGIAIAYFGFQSRISHFRLRASAREMLEMMKLAQASAIRSNSNYRIQMIDNVTYQFQEFSPTGGWLDSFSGSTGRIGQTVNLTNGIFIGQNVCGAAPGVFPCTSPQFQFDGTLNPAPGGNQIQVSDGNEAFTIDWSIGGSIRVQ